MSTIFSSYFYCPTRYICLKKTNNFLYILELSAQVTMMLIADHDDADVCNYTDRDRIPNSNASRGSIRQRCDMRERSANGDSVAKTYKTSIVIWNTRACHCLS
ncbi:UNVERIFIED_CONTAM: hypothetical protein NCL1_46872 [Trichonephila clavipes]